MKYPSRSEYYSAIRNPQFAFRKKDTYSQSERDLDSSLVNGKALEKVKSNGIKDIWSAAGSFAIVFKYETYSPKKIWAIKCFYRSNFDIINHYKKILKNLKNSSIHSYFVDFALLEEGIRVQGDCYPVLKMEWIEEENLKKFIKANLNRKNILKSLAEQWLKLSKDLLDAGIAHGDLQHGNIVVINRFDRLSLKLLDYDSLYFAKDFQSVEDNIKGLSDYQHPLRKSLDKRCLEIDFFPQLVIYLSILALAEDKKLWNTHNLELREGLLFSRADFENPEQANIFKTLAHLPDPIPALANKLKKICQLTEFRNIPSLDRAIAEALSPETNQIVELTNKSELNPRKFIAPIFSGLTKEKSRIQNTLIALTKIKLIPSFHFKNNSLKQQESFISKSKPAANIPFPSITTQIFHQPTLSITNSIEWNPRSCKTSHPHQSTLVNINYHNEATRAKKIKIIKATEVRIWLDNKTKIFLRQLRRTKKSLLINKLRTRRNLRRTYNSAIEHLNEFRNKLDKTFSTTSDRLQNIKEQTKKIIKDKTRAKTWTTKEIAAQLGCSVSWCHGQRYQHPEEFHSGIHYYKDEEGIIQWTRSGIKQLLLLRDRHKADNIPSNLLPTKAVSTLLGISPEWIIQAKTKYSSNFVEGIHYHINARKQYVWTPAGIGLLQQLLIIHSQQSSHSKTKS
ncbi:protein kinase family protein [Pleurocapsales cyanobacterium LEGE 06147]|nr:protein kinase family protein [Pleurocapsales cyanobacterium LEGE 06147]